MIRFSTLGLHKLTQSQMLESQSRIAETQIQISSGKVSRGYAGIATDSRRLVNMENAVAEIERFVKNIDTTEARLALMESSISDVFEAASGFRDLLVGALNFENASYLSLNQQAEDLLQGVATALNVKHDGRFLFSGSRIDTPPVNMAVLLSPTPPLIDAAVFGGSATNSGTGLTALTGIAAVQVDSGTSGDAFQVEYDDATQTFTVTNLNGGASDSALVTAAPAPGTTSEIGFDVGGRRVVLTLDDSFDPSTAIVSDTILGNVDTSGGGLGAFGPITVTDTSGDISNIINNTIEITGTAANATVTLFSSDGNFVATGVDLSAIATLPVTLGNATTGATVSLSVDVTTGLDDAAVADPDTEIRLDDFLENVAASNGTVNVEDARPGDPGYDPANPGYYDGNNASLSVRVDPNATVDYGVTADEPAIEKLVRALYMVRDANVTPGNVDRTTLEAALGLAAEAIAELPDIRSNIGSDRLALERVKSRHQDFLVFTREAIGELENVDVAAAVARLSSDQVHLEASFMLTARLSQLTLANFLR